ncbi:MAG: MCE family protein [Acidobacteriaceae bacterium]|nr:MCE family protein [Acidobacteriaceae bacterium]
MRNGNVAIGMFVVTGLALFTLVLFTIGNQHSFFSRHFDVYTEFANIDGLMKGAEVEIDGFQAGELADITVPDSASGHFRLKLRINQRFKPLVKTDSVVTIGIEGIVGDKFVEIQSGSADAPEATSSNTLPSKEPLSTANLLQKGGDLIDTANGTIKALQGKVFGTLDVLTKTINNTDDVITSVKQGKGTVGMLLSDDAVARDVRQAVSNAEDATVSVKHASGEADGLVAGLRSRGIDSKVDQTILSARSAAGNLDATSAALRDAITEAFGPDDENVPGGDNIRQTLSNLNRATGNMAADTEALKHEFFFRGFFKHRGYYSLANLNPDTYRKDKLLAAPANSRVWLKAAKLFEKRQDGKECLSVPGKAQIDAAVAELGDAAVNGPLIVEGYSSSADSATQLIASRERALLVRGYIHSRYQIDLRSLGAVALGSLPPPSVHEASWDGVSIVMLRPASE